MRAASGAPRANAGVSLLELTIVLALIGVLVAVAAERLTMLRIAAERLALERTLATLRTVVVLELAERLIAGRDPAELDGGNPMALWEKHVEYPLPRYVGELPADAAEPPAGSWYYRPGEGVLVYRALFPDAIRSDGPDPAAARFRMNVRRGADGRITGIRLDVLDEFVTRKREGEYRSDRKISYSSRIGSSGQRG